MSSSTASTKPLVLIGFAEALSAPEVAWSLADAGFEVRSFGRKGRRSALSRSRYASVLEVTPPEADAAATVEEICSIARSANLAGGARAGRHSSLG